MWIRSAFWVGAARASAQAQFETAMNEDLGPALRALPGVRDARVLWPRRFEDQPPAIACQVLVEFDSHQDLERMLNSQERSALREKVRYVALNLFEGALSHIDYEVG